MELLEITREIEKAKTLYETAKTEEQAAYYKSILNELRIEKKEILDKEFNRS